jgi:hypothetical protein
MTHQIVWREVDSAPSNCRWLSITTRPVWHLLLGNESVAQILPNKWDGTPCWLTAIWDYPDYGWHAVDFFELDEAKVALTRWHHAVFDFGDPAERAAFWAQAREMGYAVPGI